MRFMGNIPSRSLFDKEEVNRGSLAEKLQSWVAKMKQKALRSIISRIFSIFQLSRNALGIEDGKSKVIDYIDPEEIDGKQTLKKLAMVVIASMVIVGILFYPQLIERGVPVSVKQEINASDETNLRAISDRLLYQEIAFEMIKAKPILGIGYKNFVLEMDNYTKEPLKSHQHQPVHNIYLLIAAEMGIIGLVVFLLFIFSTLRSAWKNPLTPFSITFLSIFIGFLFIGLFDHYLWTIQQGQLMFFVVSGLLIGALEKH
jgi:O-antigen ligase